MCLTSLYEFSYSKSLRFSTEISFYFQMGKLRQKEI